MNITEDEENIYLHAEIPGVDPDHLSISALRDSVSLAGKRVPWGAREGTQDGFGRQDCAFNCTVALPAEVDADRVDAHYCEGILSLTLRKAQPQPDYC
jgi:HSP20 family protein